MTKDEALKLALEALEKHAELGLLAGATITAIREALAQPEQEPVAFICEFYADEGHPFVSFEPVTHGTNTPLYSTPPQRKPLTDEEIILIVAECASSHQHTDIHFARAIERAHGIKELV